MSEHIWIWQALSVVTPLMVTGLVAWGHLSNKVSEVRADVRAQNGRICKLEAVSVHKETCTAYHNQTAQAVARLENVIKEAHDERRVLFGSIDALRDDLLARSQAIGELLALTREKRASKGLSPDYDG